MIEKSPPVPYVARILFFLALLVGVFVLPHAVMLVALVYATLRGWWENVLAGFFLDALYAPLFPVWGVAMPHVCATIFLLCMFGYVRERVLPV
jgi:hypothetical protein